MRIVGMPIWIALAMLFLLKMILAYAAGCYGEKRGYQKWLLFVVAVLLDPVAVFAIILMLPSMSSAKEPHALGGSRLDVGNGPGGLLCQMCSQAVLLKPYVLAYLQVKRSNLGEVPSVNYR